MLLQIRKLTHAAGSEQLEHSLLFQTAHTRPSRCWLMYICARLLGESATLAPEPFEDSTIRRWLVKVGRVTVTAGPGIATGLAQTLKTHWILLSRPNGCDLPHQGASRAICVGNRRRKGKI